MLKKIITPIQKYYHVAITFLLLLANRSVFADDDPFPTINTSGDITHTIGSNMETAFKYILIGTGGLLIIICITVLIHRLREDHRDREFGSLIMTFIFLAVGALVGFLLIGIGWTAFNTQIQ